MSDGLPTDEQLRRIERGVRGRIDARRRAARGLAGGAAGVLLFAGAIALVVPLASGGASSGAGSAAGGAGGSEASAASAGVQVRCHLEGGTRTVAAPDDPDRIAEACGAGVDFQSGSGRMPSAASSAPAPRASGAVAVVCRAEDGAFDVYPAGDRPSTVCARRGLQPY